MLSSASLCTFVSSTAETHARRVYCVVSVGGVVYAPPPVVFGTTPATSSALQKCGSSSVVCCFCATHQTGGTTARPQSPGTPYCFCHRQQQRQSPRARLAFWQPALAAPAAFHQIDFCVHLGTRATLCRNLARAKKT